MSCNENKSMQNEQTDAKKDLLNAACTAADAILTSIAGTKLFKNIIQSAAKGGLDVVKAEKQAGLVSAGLSASTLLKGDFIPTLAQAIDRAWAKKGNAANEECIEECAACTDECTEEVACETTEEETFIVVEEVVSEAAPEVESVPVMADAEETEEKDDEGEEENEAFAGFSTAGLEFFDAKEKPEEYDALVARENAGEIRIVTRYRRSFLSRLIQSQGDVQTYYSEIKNRLLSYKGVKGRTSWGNESFNKGRTYVAKVNAKSKTLYLYLALDPAMVEALEDGKYNITDMSAKKKYENVPTLIKVKGPRKLKHALELIDLLCRESLALPDAKGFIETDYTVPYQTTEELVETGAVKMMVAGISMSDITGDVPETVDIFPVEAV